ncbi:hypothetical protein [Campylobacter mucosalis]|uniref:MmcB family DNA repair protein n=1 Tax=Campylobacter mucosalis CCUG 21559 TaxID=1032067 RepID=A0A6G5QGA2_9BACT|nr:hypothetical protein [Campylobacter mucosalis]QCD44089.1 hypothetical protein CMUC_0275 [Campylobacter mucosalis CCUG 21559]QCD44427.1 hypothetical protein CMUC_0628 [Campylobacter mucosalis CCUG 21559]QCD44681.1 hypothetical protein CMUC_0892 [Campylobacter mucosalis CCUG 21559]
MIDSQVIKSLLFKYFRFKRQMLCVSEAVVYYRDIEDFIAFNNNEIYCIEVKVDKSDFIKDFTTKEKHRKSMKYHKFYFCVPESLVDFSLAYLKNYPNYGLLVARNNKIESRKIAKSNKSVLKIEQKIYNSLILRMSSELANEKLKTLKEQK